MRHRLPHALVCKVVGPRGVVFCVRTGPRELPASCANRGTHHIEWCTTVNSACGTSDGPAYLATGLNGYIQARSDSVANCRMTSLDSFTDERKLSKVDLVKIDVEGFEMDVLSGMSAMVKRDRPDSVRRSASSWFLRQR